MGEKVVTFDNIYKMHVENRESKTRIKYVEPSVAVKYKVVDGKKYKLKNP